MFRERFYLSEQDQKENDKRRKELDELFSRRINSEVVNMTNNTINNEVIDITKRIAF